MAPFEYEIVTKTTTTGKKTHVIYVGDNKYLSRGIKKNGQSFFYCNFVSVHHKCTSSFRVRYHDLHNPNLNPHHHRDYHLPPPLPPPPHRHQYNHPPATSEVLYDYEEVVEYDEQPLNLRVSCNNNQQQTSCN